MKQIICLVVAIKYLLIIYRTQLRTRMERIQKTTNLRYHPVY